MVGHGTNFSIKWLKALMTHPICPVNAQIQKTKLLSIFTTMIYKVYRQSSWFLHARDALCMPLSINKTVAHSRCWINNIWLNKWNCHTMVCRCHVADIHRLTDSEIVLWVEFHVYVWYYCICTFHPISVCRLIRFSCCYNSGLHECVQSLSY